jgi:hypothetical protein
MATNKLGQIKFAFGLIAMTGFAAFASVAQAAPVQSGSAMNTLLSQANLNLDAPSKTTITPVGSDKSQVRPVNGSRVLEQLPGVKKNPLNGVADNGVCNGGGCAADSLPSMGKLINPAVKQLPVVRPAAHP